MSRFKGTNPRAPRLRLACLQQSGRRAQNLATAGGEAQKRSQSSASDCSQVWIGRHA